MIRFENVTIRFNNNELLRNLTFTIKAQDKFLIYGKSGIGKTTIFRLLLGFEGIQEGKIFFEDQPINEKKVWEIRRRIAYVSQDLDIGSGKVENLLQQPLSYKANAHLHHAHALIDNLLSFFELPGSIINESYEKLSGGEKQRIAIINALLLERDIFLLDEATSALDIEMKMKTIRHFIANRKWTVVAISHDRDWYEQDGLKVIRIGDR